MPEYHNIPANLLHKLRRSPQQHPPEMLRLSVREEILIPAFVTDFACCGHRVEDDAFLDLHDVGVDFFAVEGCDDGGSFRIEVFGEEPGGVSVGWAWEGRGHTSVEIRGGRSSR